MIWIWIGLMVLFMIGEAMTPGVLVSIWFAGGSLVALVSALFGAPLWLQIALCLVVSLALLIATRPIAIRSINQKKQATNADRMIGQTGVVTEEIDNLKNRGQVLVGGNVWSARTATNEPAQAGAKVRVVNIEGVKAVVEEIGG